MALIHVLALGLVVYAGGALAQSAPNCTLFSVDMAFCGTEGLITAKNQATVVLRCDQTFSGLCSATQDKCLKIQGPQKPVVQSLTTPSSANNAVQAAVAWEASYRGPISLTVPCALSNAAGLTSSVSPLNFIVKDTIPITSSAFEIF